MFTKAVSETTEQDYRRVLAALLDNVAAGGAAAYGDVLTAVAERATPSRVAAHLAGLASGGGASLSSLRRVRAAVDWAFSEAGAPSPTASPEVESVWTGILRAARGEAPPDDVILTAVRAPDLLRLVEATATPAQDASAARPPYVAPRDTLLLLLGAATMLRASELAELTFGDVAPEGGGVSVRLPEGRRVHVTAEPPLPSPAVALGALLVAVRGAGLSCEPDDPVFRAADRWDVPRDRPIGKSDVARIARRAAARAGLDGAAAFGATRLARMWHQAK